ncbi:MAG: SLBB domain-containing protein, partial [Bacteroidota bacterium]
MSSKGIRLLAALSLYLTFSLTFSQDLNSLSASDLNNVNIDALSDEQIQQFYDKAQESGLTLDQMELAAKKRGMSSSQIAKLRTRIMKLGSGSNNQGGAFESASSRLRDQQDNYPAFDLLNSADTSQVDKVPYYGLDIFRSSNLSFEPSLNVATPENYILGAGDEIVVDVYGASEITYQQTISPEGTILISGVGPISLSGSSIKEAKRRVFNKHSNIYSGLKGSYPNTFLQVSIGQVRSIKVNVVGHVAQPGSYTISSFATAFNALYYAGGPTNSGSMRQIEVIRDGEKVATLDVYKYLFDGDDSENPQLQDQDLIVVKPYINRIWFAGNVKYPAIYELKSNESITDLLNVSGGFTSSAFKKSLTINRAGDEQRKVATFFESNYDKVELIDGDSIFVSKISDRYSNRVKVEGSVIREGYFELTDELTLSRAIKLAGGLREDAYLGRANIIRLTSDLRLTNISFNVENVLTGSEDVILNANDIIRISSIFDLEEDQVVSLMGEIRRPGEYPFIDSMTVEDLVTIAGGLRERASKSIVEVARRLSNNDDITKSAEVVTFSISEDLGLSSEASNFILKPFDLVTIKSSSYKQGQKVVKIEGEVKYPGFYVLETNEDRISDLIKRAGGLTDYGYAEGASLIRRTEYFRTQYQKEELEALLKTKREELEER